MLKPTYYNADDTIKLNISIENNPPSEYSTGGSYIQFDVIINGNKIKHHSDYVAFLLNSRKCKVDCYGDKVEYSLFEPFTCSCGIAGCAGIWDGIYSKHRKRTVEWLIPKGEGYVDFMNKTFYSFSRLQYEGEIAKVWKWFKDNSDKLVMINSYDDEENKVDTMIQSWYSRFQDDTKWLDSINSV